jgi:hypothetical protein
MTLEEACGRMLKWTVWFIFRTLERLRKSRIADLCGRGSNGGTPCKPQFTQDLVRFVLTATNLCYSTFLALCTLRVLDFSGFESRCGRDFPYPSRPVLRPTQRSAQWIPGLLFGGKATGAWRYHPPPSSAEVKERVEVYLPLYVPSWHVTGRPLALHLRRIFLCIIVLF